MKKSNRFYALSTLSLAIAVFAAACSHAPGIREEHEVPFFGSTKAHRYRFPNGLKLVVIEDHSAPTIAYQTWFKVGSRDEEPGLTGLAHLFEHMMFKGTKNQADGQFDKQLSQAGADGLNAFTSRDYTGYVQNLPSDSLDLIAKLESDRMVNLLVDDEPLKKEKEVVQNERRFRNENSPDGQMYEKIYDLAYTKHNYRWPVIGSEQDIANASRKDCESFYKRFYAPNNATIAIVGDVTPSAALSVVKKYYAGLSASKVDRKKSPAEPDQKSERRQSIELKTAVHKLMIAYHIPDVNSFQYPALEVVRNILVEGKGSRLHRKLVDAGIATNVGIGNGEHVDPGLFFFYVNMQKGKTADQALAVIDREIKEMTAGKITDDEVAKAVAMAKLQLFTELSSNFTRAQFVGFYETVAGRLERGVDIVNALGAIDKRMITQVTKAFLQKSNRSVLIGAPKS